MINTSGNTLPASIPYWRLSPFCWVIEPTRLGPNAPPRSPAIASMANSAVPPCGMRGDMRLSVPGHMMPTERDDECELGYWLGKPFWGQGLIPEAVKEILRHAFEDIGMSKVWVGYYDGNTKSKRVQEKCGFRYEWKSEDVDVPLMHDKRTGYVSSLTKDQWQRDGK